MDEILTLLLSKTETGMVLAGIPLVPVIVALVQMVKRYFPQARDEVWYGLTFVFGALGQVGVSLALRGNKVWDLTTGLTFVTMVLLGGLAAGKYYDDRAKAGKLARASVYKK